MTSRHDFSAWLNGFRRSVVLKASSPLTGLTDVSHTTSSGRGPTAREAATLLPTASPIALGLLTSHTGRRGHVEPVSRPVPFWEARSPKGGEVRARAEA
jgi:hypothetical protein